MGVGQSVPNNQSRSARLLAMGTSSPTSTPNANSTQMTVRDHINKEFKSKDHTQHALYNLLSTGKAGPLINSSGNSVSSNAILAKESRDRDIESRESTASQVKMDIDKHATDLKSKVQNGPINQETKCDTERRTTPSPQIKDDTAPEKATEASPTFLHPKKKFLYRQQQLTSDQPKSPNETRSNEQSKSPVPNSTMTTSHVASNNRLQPTHMMPSPPKSSETVKSCMEKIMEHMLHAYRTEDQEKEKTNQQPQLRSQEHMIQEKIKQFLQDDPTPGPEASKNARALHSNRRVPDKAKSDSKGGYMRQNPVKAESSHDLTVAQRIHMDISHHVLSDHESTDTRTPSGLPTPARQADGSIVVRLHRPESASAAMAQASRDATSPHFQEGVHRDVQSRPAYCAGQSDGRASVESQQSEGRRDSFGKSSVYEKLRETAMLHPTHERNCSSTDTARGSDPRDLEANPYYRGRSRTISYPIKSPYRSSSTYPNPAHSASFNPSHAISQARASLYMDAYPASTSVSDSHRDPRNIHREALTSHALTSHYGNAEKTGAPRDVYNMQGRTDAQLGSMFYQPHKPASTHGGSISAGLPRTYISDQRENLLKEAYELRNSAMPNRESNPHKRRHDEMIDRPPGDRAPPHLLHMSNRLQVPGQDLHDIRNQPMTSPRSRSRSPLSVPASSAQHHEYRHEESHVDAPLDLSKPSTPYARSSDSRDPLARDAKATPLPPLAPYAYHGKAMMLAEQALKAAQMSPAQIALYQQEWLKQYRWPPAVLSESLAAAQLSAAAHLLPPAFDPRTLTSPTDPRMTSSSISPRPTGEADDRDYQMRFHQRMYRDHSPNACTSPRDHHDPHSLPSLQVPPLPVAPGSSLHVKGVAGAPVVHSPHARQPSPVSRDTNKERLTNRSIGPNLLGDFPPEDVLFLRCNLCRDTYGNVHSFIKHFTRDHANEGDPRPHHVIIESIANAKARKHVIEVNHIARPMDQRPLDPRAIDPRHRDPRLIESSLHYPAMAKAQAEQMSRSHEMWGSKEGPKGVLRPSSPSVMRCPKCPQFSTRDWGIYKRHMKAHDNVGKSHDSSSHDALHVRADVTARAQSRQQTLVCDECHVNFHDNLEWQLHMSISHSSHTCVCRICNVGFGHIDAMYKHVYTAHNGLNSVEVEFNCLSCSKAFTNERSLIEHIKSKECGIDRNSIGSMISLSVKSRVRDQAVSMSPPPKRHRMTPDTTCSEDKPIATESVPVTTIADTMSSNSIYQGSNVHNTMSTSVQSTGRRSNEITVIDLIQQKVEQEHRRQSGDVMSRDTSNSTTDFENERTLQSRQNSNRDGNPTTQDERFMSPLKRRLLGYDKVDVETTPIKQLKMNQTLVGDRRSPSQRITLNAQSIISNIVERTVLGPNMDFDTMYKRSIARMITEENERDKRNELIVKQDADSSLQKTDSPSVPVPEDKKYQQSLKGVLNSLVETEAKKVFSKDEPLKSEVKEESKSLSSAVRNFAPTLDQIIRSQLENSASDIAKNTVKEEHNAHSQVKCEPKSERSTADKRSDETDSKELVSNVTESVGDHLPKDTHAEPTQSPPTTEPKHSNDTKSTHTSPESTPSPGRDGLLVVNDQRVPNVEQESAKQTQTNTQQSDMKLLNNTTQSSDLTRHSDVSRGDNTTQSPDPLRHSDVSRAKQTAVAYDRFDSYEEGNLVICEDQTD